MASDQPTDATTELSQGFYTSWERVQFACPLKKTKQKKTVFTGSYSLPLGSADRHDCFVIFAECWQDLLRRMLSMCLSPEELMGHQKKATVFLSFAYCCGPWSRAGLGWTSYKWTWLRFCIWPPAGSVHLLLKPFLTQKRQHANLQGPEFVTKKYEVPLRAGCGCGEKFLGEWVVGKLPYLLLWLPNPFFFVFLAQQMIEHVAHSWLSQALRRWADRWHLDTFFQFCVDR